MVDENNDIDIETQEDDFDQDLAAKPSLRETWDSNPMLKIGAIVLAVALAGGAYFTFFGPDKEETKTMIRTPSAGDVKNIPGQSDTDSTYMNALKQGNDQRVAKAVETGTSALPTTIGSSNTNVLNLPQSTAGQADPLETWRREAEARRLQDQQKIMEQEQESAPQPDVAPLVKPIVPTQTQLKADPEAAKRLAAQMRVIIAAQVPPASKVEGITGVKSAYALMKQQEEEEKRKQQTNADGSVVNADGTTTAGAEGAAAKQKVIVAAGSILYAQLMNELNSDIPGPVLAQILSGPFSGGRALGTLALQDEYLTLTFNKVVKDGVVYSANGIALDETTTLAAHQTSVDHHYFTRVILPAAAEFIKGYASAAAETSTTTTTTDGGGVATDDPAPDANEQIMAGVEEGANKVSSILDQNANKPVTVHVAKGTTMGILFLESITTASAGKQ